MARPAQVYAQVSEFFFIGKWPMGPADSGRQHVLPAGAEHGGTESGPQARWFSVCSGSSRPLSTMSCSSEKRRPLDICMKAEEVLLPPRGWGRPAEATHGRPAQPGTQV